MNDRFKFRVWDKRRNKFIESPEPTLMLQANGLLAYFKDAKYMNNYVVQFCTGLKDKNGKLIYEGDIVKINTHYNHLVHDDYEYDYESEKGYSLFKIIYDNDMARFGAERIKCVKWETYHYSLDYVPHNHKVIGNIYENKDLLESEG